MSTLNFGAVLCVVAGTALSVSVAAHGQQSAPAGGLTLTPANPNPTLPLRIAGAMKVNGEVVLVTEWKEYRPGTSDSVPVPIFDCFEPDLATVNGDPTGFCTSCNNFNGAQYCPPVGTAAQSSRWSYATSNTAWSVNDMVMASGFNGALATRIQFAWGWGPVSGPCFIGVFTDEEFAPCGSPAPATGPFPGVVMDFGTIAGGTGSPYHWSNVDLAAQSLSIQMPMDGSGAYEILIGNAGAPFTLDTTIGTRPMLWGTGQDEQPAEARAGSQINLQWDDAGPQNPAVMANGTMDPNECWNYNFGPGAFCPFQLGSMAIFYGEPAGPACYANCDLSTTSPILNVGDFTCFLQKFAAQDPYANCDQSTTPPVLNVGDFTCFLQKFAAGCP